MNWVPVFLYRVENQPPENTTYVYLIHSHCFCLKLRFSALYQLITIQGCFCLKMVAVHRRLMR